MYLNEGKTYSILCLITLSANFAWLRLASWFLCYASSCPTASFTVPLCAEVNFCSHYLLPPLINHEFCLMDADNNVAFPSISRIRIIIYKSNFGFLINEGFVPLVKSLACLACFFMQSDISMTEFFLLDA
jgi:hypothetical protein